MATNSSPAPARVSVLFNEPKLLKSKIGDAAASFRMRFSALQRAEIAEMNGQVGDEMMWIVFQCSSTSRNC